MPPTPMLKPVEWMGSAREDLREMPDAVQDAFGYALHQAQIGKYHPSAKQLKRTLGGLIELVEDFDGDSYRAAYTVKLAGSSTCCTSSRRSPPTGSPRPSARSP